MLKFQGPLLVVSMKQSEDWNVTTVQLNNKHTEELQEFNRMFHCKVIWFADRV